jgi:hypothetical protein
MATPEFTSQERETLYRLLTLINGSLNFVALRLEEMAASKILSPKYLTETKVLTQEVKEMLEKRLREKQDKIEAQ